MIAATRPLGLKLLDHVIVAEGTIFSFADSGLLDELELLSLAPSDSRRQPGALTSRTQIQHRTWGVEEVAEQMFQRLKSIDKESKEAEDPEDRTSYAKKYPLEWCEQIVQETLRRAGIKTGRIIDENRQKFLQALGTLRRRRPPASS